MTYGKFVHGLKLANIEVDRKVLADLAVHNESAFKTLEDHAKDAVAKATA